VMHERALSVHLEPQIEAECIHDLSKLCSEKTAKSEVLPFIFSVYLAFCRNLFCNLFFGLICLLIANAVRSRDRNEIKNKGK